jgi:hypothetical protein
MHPHPQASHENRSLPPQLPLPKRHTKSDVLEDTSDELDFTPECDVDQLTRGVHHDKCTKPAAWVGIAPCGHDCYFCETHHYDQRAFICHVCGRNDLHLATYKWIRL